MPIRYSVTNHVATVTLDRPEALNALELDSLRELREKLADARDDDDVRVIILTGAGTKSFCVGADLKNTLPPTTQFSSAFVKSIDRAAAEGIYVRLIDLGSLRIFKPLIAAINGYCLGGGLELALQCDLRIAAEHAVFGLPEATVASIPAVCGIQALLRAVPSALAMKMLLTGQKNRRLARRASRTGFRSRAGRATAKHGEQRGRDNSGQWPARRANDQESCRNKQ